VVTGNLLRPTRISALATYVPPGILDNKQLSQMVGTTEEWILQRTGIRTRHIAEKGVPTSDLAKEAALMAIAQRGISPADIDLVIVGTTTPDMVFPSTAALVQDKIGATQCWGFDLAAACSGFTFAVATASQLVSTGKHDCALVLGADVMSSIIDYTDRTTCVLFGDGAGAVLIEPAIEDGLRIIDFANEIDGSGRDALLMPAGGSLNPATHETVEKRMHFVRQDGGAVFKFAVRKTEEIGRRVMARNGVTAEDVALFVSHQANRRIIMSAADRLGFPESKVMINVEDYGNTTAATIPLALEDALKQGRLKKGDLVLLTSVGAGYTVGSVFLRWAI
jgi:3-oxoacyl-[acyl-carrier-protein] synthase-3